MCLCECVCKALWSHIFPNWILLHDLTLEIYIYIYISRSCSQTHSHRHRHIIHGLWWLHRCEKSNRCVWYQIKVYYSVKYDQFPTLWLQHLWIVRHKHTNIEGKNGAAAPTTIIHAHNLTVKIIFRIKILVLLLLLASTWEWKICIQRQSATSA